MRLRALHVGDLWVLDDPEFAAPILRPVPTRLLRDSLLDRIDVHTALTIGEPWVQFEPDGYWHEDDSLLRQVQLARTGVSPEENDERRWLPAYCGDKGCLI